MLAVQSMAQLMTQSQCTQGPDSVHKKRMGTIKRIDKPSVLGCFCPPCSLYCTRRLYRQIIKMALPFCDLKSFFLYPPTQRTIGAYVIEAMIMHANMRNMRCHFFYCCLSAHF